MHISLPEGPKSTSMRQRVNERVAEEQYGTPSEYVRALIREDQKKRRGERASAGSSSCCWTACLRAGQRGD